MLRRVHPLPIRNCRCGRPLDSLGHHRAACAVAGVLGRRGFPLESAAARVCREVGARVRTNVVVRDLDLWPPHRRLEVVADGLPLHGGAQLAIDTTALTHDGTARPGADPHDGVALTEARRRKERTCPELSGEGGRARLVVLAAEVGGRWSDEARTFLGSLARGESQVPLSCCGTVFEQRGSTGGDVSSHALLLAVSLCPCSTQPRLGLTVTFPPCRMC